MTGQTPTSNRLLRLLPAGACEQLADELERQCSVDEERWTHLSIRTRKGRVQDIEVRRETGRRRIACGG